MIPGEQYNTYELTGIILYTKLSKTSGHYTAFFRSSKNHKQWFYANDTEVQFLFTYNLYSVTICTPYFRLFQLALQQFCNNSHICCFINYKKVIATACTCTVLIYLLCTYIHIFRWCCKGFITKFLLFNIWQKLPY